MSVKTYHAGKRVPAKLTDNGNVELERAIPITDASCVRCNAEASDGLCKNCNESMLKGAKLLSAPYSPEYMAISEHAKALFGKYGQMGGFKVYKETGSQVLFVDKDCDISSSQSYEDTCQYGFWLWKHEDIKLQKPCTECKGYGGFSHGFHEGPSVACPSCRGTGSAE